MYMYNVHVHVALESLCVMNRALCPSLQMLFHLWVYFTGNVRFDALDTLMEANEIALQKILESSEDGGVEAVGKLKSLYRSCMDLTTINSLGSAPIVQLISSVGMYVSTALRWWEYM